MTVCFGWRRTFIYGFSCMGLYSIFVMLFTLVGKDWLVICGYRYAGFKF